MIPLSLTEITDAVGGRLLSPGVPPYTLVSGSVQTDSRLVEAGSIFFALRGDETDGHLFAPVAAQNGASVVIAEWPIELDVPVIVVADGVTALADLARFVVARVRERGTLSVIGITGSNGKTTTKNMLGAILSEQAPTVAPVGSFNNHVGAPISMLRIDEKTRYLVVEMGASHAGEIAHLVSIAKPDIGVVLKVGLAHVGEFGGIDAIEKAKAEMVTGLAASGVAILNIDDPRVAAMAALTPATVRGFGLSRQADVRGRSVRADLLGTRFTVVAGDHALPIALRILGEHHVLNALAALAVARELGIDLGHAIAALETMHRAERWRMETLTTPAGATVINDAYNASPDSTEAALRTLVQVRAAGSRAIAILGEMTELGDASHTHHFEIGRLATSLGLDLIVVVGRPARSIYEGAILDESFTGRVEFVESPREALDLLVDELRDGDLALVKSSKSANLRFLGDRLAGVAV